MTHVLFATMLALSASPESDDQRARALMRTAQQAYRDGQFRQALTTFREVLALRPRPGVHYNLGRCHEGLGEVGLAMREYREYLRLAPAATDRATVQELVTALEARLLATRVRQLAIVVEPIGASITVDGAEVGPPPAYVELGEGVHVVAVRALGFETEQRSIDVSGAKLPELVLQLRREVKVEVPSPQRPAPPAPALVARAEPTPRVATWATAGVSVVAAGVGALFGALANGSSSTLRTLLHERTFADVLVERVQLQATAANVSWAVAGAALVTAVILFFVEAR